MQATCSICLAILPLPTHPNTHVQAQAPETISDAYS